MNKQEEKIFPEGFIYKQAHPNAPDFVEGAAAIKVDEFKAWLDRVQGEWVNLDFKVSKAGKAYAEVNTFKPDASKASGTAPQPVTAGGAELDDDLPF